MPRRKTHKIAVRTVGLTDEQAAQLHYLVSCAARSFFSGPDADGFDTVSNVPVKVLRATFPDDDWYVAKRQERIDLVT